MKLDTLTSPTPLLWSGWRWRGIERYPFASHALPLLFIPLAFTLFLPAPWVLLGFLVAPAYYITRWRLLGAPIPSAQVNLPIAVLLLGMLVGFVISPARETGALAAGKFLASLTTFYVLLDVLKTRAHAWRATGVLVLLGVGLVFLLPFSVSWVLDKVFVVPGILDWTLRPPGQGTNANIVAGVLALIFPLSLALLFAPLSRLRILGALAVGPLMVGLGILQSRGAWFATLGGLAVGASFYKRWLVPLIPLLILGALVLNQQFGGSQGLANVIFGKIGTVTGGTLIERQALWTQAIALIRAQPLTGIGMGAYETVAPYAPPYSVEAPGLKVSHAHNVFLQVALDAGVLGFVGFTGVFALAGLAAWRSNQLGIAKPLALGLLGSFGVVLLHCFVDGIFWNFKAQWALWYLFGIAVALRQVKD